MYTFLKVNLCQLTWQGNQLGGGRRGGGYMRVPNHSFRWLGRRGKGLFRPELNLVMKWLGIFLFHPWIGCQLVTGLLPVSKTESIRKLSNFNFQWAKILCSAVARPNGQPRQAGVARGVRGHAPPEKFWTLVSRKCDLQCFLGLSVTFFRVNLSGI